MSDNEIIQKYYGGMTVKAIAKLIYERGRCNADIAVNRDEALSMVEKAVINSLSTVKM